MAPPHISKREVGGPSAIAVDGDCRLRHAVNVSGQGHILALGVHVHFQGAIELFRGPAIIRLGSLKEGVTLRLPLVLRPDFPEAEGSNRGQLHIRNTPASLQIPRSCQGHIVNRAAAVRGRRRGGNGKGDSRLIVNIEIAGDVRTQTVNLDCQGLIELFPLPVFI